MTLYCTAYVHLFLFKGYNRCYVVGHDWGGTIAWLFAIHYPEMVTKLIVLNCPHPTVFTGNIHHQKLLFLAASAQTLLLTQLIRRYCYISCKSASSWQIPFRLR